MPYTTINQPKIDRTILSRAGNCAYQIEQVQIYPTTPNILQISTHCYRTSYVLEGHGTIHIGNRLFPINDYLQGLMTADTLAWYLEDLAELSIMPGVVVNLPPKTIYQFVTSSKLVLLEVKDLVDLDQLLMIKAS